MQYTIKKSEILKAETLATLYAGELRGKGYTPRMTPAVTPEKVLRVEFQNGALNKITLPVGKLATWARTFDGETEFGVEFTGRKMFLLHGASQIGFIDRATNEHGEPVEKPDAALSEVPPIRFDDDNGKRADFQLVTPAETENLAAKIKSQKAARELAKLREKEISAKRALKNAAAQHCENLRKCGAETTSAGIVFALPAYESAVTRARHFVRAFRMFRSAIKNPLNVIAWLGESVTPAGEYDAGPVNNFTPEHGEKISAVLSARAAVASYKPRMVKCSWSNERTPKYGPQFEKLKSAGEKAESSLFMFIKYAFETELEKNGLPAPWIYFNDGKMEIHFKSDCREYSRARQSVRGFADQKAILAQDYIEALAKRRKFQAKAVAGGDLITAKATLTDGKVNIAAVTPEQLEKAKITAQEKGATIEIISDNKVEIKPDAPVAVVAPEVAAAFNMAGLPNVKIAAEVPALGNLNLHNSILAQMGVVSGFYGETDQEIKPASENFHRLKAEDQARIFCQNPNCKNHADFCEHCHWKVGSRKGVSFFYHCAACFDEKQKAEIRANELAQGNENRWQFHRYATGANWPRNPEKDFYVASRSEYIKHDLTESEAREMVLEHNAKLTAAQHNAFPNGRF